jgi:hypothetical protein
MVTLNLQRFLFEDFGKYVFDVPRKDVPTWDKEEMSLEETRALDLLQKFFQTRSQQSKQELTGVMPKLLRMKDRYPDELDPASVTYLYRATSWNTREQALKMLKAPQEVDSAEQFKVQFGSLKLKPKPSDSGISIWTTAANLETTLVDTVGLKAGFVTVFRAPTQNNPFLGNPGKLAAVLGISGLEPEMEVLGFGSIVCDAVSFSSDGTHTLPNFEAAFAELTS